MNEKHFPSLIKMNGANLTCGHFIFLKNEPIEVVLLFKWEISQLLSFLLKVIADFLMHGLSV